MVKQEIHSFIVLRVFVKELTLAINRNILVRWWIWIQKVNVKFI